MSDVVTILGFIIGIIGLIATLVGTYFTYISFINPITRFKKYLKNPENWEKFQGIENHLSFYRHKKYPNFQIVIDWDKELVENFHEEWINDSLYPDKTNNASCYVQLQANGSRTTHPFGVTILIRYSIRAIGLTVGWLLDCGLFIHSFQFG
jgi:hypothetical protein